MKNKGKEEKMRKGGRAGEGSQSPPTTTPLSSIGDGDQVELQILVLS